MEIKNPFSLYDFLGYFIPGALSIYITMFFIRVFDYDLYQSVTSIAFGRVDLSIAFIIVSYALGHGINFLSSITIEKYSIWKNGFPSHYLLENSDNVYYSKKANQIKIFYLSQTTFLIQVNINKDPGFKDKKGYLKVRKLALFWRILLWLLILPITFTDYIIGTLGGINKYSTNPLCKVLADLIVEKIVILLDQLNINRDQHFDFHRIIQHYYYEKYNKHLKKFDNYIALYGFTRSLALICSISTMVFIITSLVQTNILIGSSYSIGILGKWIISLFLLTLSYIFYMAFAKFYRRYTLENFMCLVIDKDLITEQNSRYQKHIEDQLNIQILRQ